jgi:hypothetical protein
MLGPSRLGHRAGVFIGRVLRDASAGALLLTCADPVAGSIRYALINCRW